MDKKKLVGQKIKSAREGAGLTQKELGKKVGYSAMGISHLEKGLRNIKITDLEKIAQALDTDINYFLEPFAGALAQYPNVTYRRGEEDLSDEEKKLEKETIAKFEKHIKSLAKKQK